MPKPKKCPVMLRNKPGQLCEEECPAGTNSDCEFIDGWGKLASHKWPLERHAERQANKCAAYLSKNIFNGLTPTKKELVRIEVKMYLLRALKYGQRHGGSK